MNNKQSGKQNWNYKHGHCSGGKTKQYHVWRSMISRCENKNNKNYHHYGGRGINVCKRWRESYQTFLNDMGPKPDGMYLERIHNSKGYSKPNCKWGTCKQQQNNKRSNRILKLNGQSMTIAQWADHLKVNKDMLYMRLFRGWSHKRILTYGL